MERVLKISHDTRSKSPKHIEGHNTLHPSICPATPSSRLFRISSSNPLTVLFSRCSHVSPTDSECATHNQRKRNPARARHSNSRASSPGRQTDQLHDSQLD